MKFGACVGTDIEKMKYIKEIGFDYAESHCQELVNKPMEHIEAMKNVGIPVLSANCFIGLRLLGPEKDEAAIAEYLEKLFARASYLGLKYLVFGSSGARRIPEGMSLEEGRSEIVDFLKDHVVPVCEKYKTITIAIEPLRPQECNAVNTVADGVEIAKKVNSPYVKVLADVAHMFYQNEDLNSLESFKGWLVHAHTSNPDVPPEMNRKRIYPKEGDGYDQSVFLKALAAAGVEQCSVEAEVIDFRVDAENAVRILKNSI